MSYGLNIEMHKQVGGKAFPGAVIPGEGALSALPFEIQGPPTSEDHNAGLWAPILDSGHPVVLPRASTDI